MSRHRRANSDLYGVKNPRNSKSNSFRQTQTVFTNHNLSSYEPKSALSKKTNCPETPTKKIDAQELILDSFKLLKHFYQNQDTDYFNRIKKYLNGEWQSQRKVFVEHFNKLSYLQEEMQKKNYHQIQLEVIAEWRKNPVLYCIRAMWYQFMISCKFASIGDFMKQYNIFRDFVGQLAFLFFKRFFLTLGAEKQMQKILDKLTERTSHLIITYTSTWCKVSDRIVLPLLKLKLQNPRLQEIEISKFDLQSLEMKSLVVDLSKKDNQMPKTTDSIQKFIIEHKILQKIRLLLDIRHNMEQEIKRRQQNLIKLGEIKELKILDKDDFVDCLIYCVVRGDISLEKLGLSIKYLYYILGTDIHNILSKFRCDPYLADLEAVFDFLVIKMSQNGQSQTDPNKENKNINQ